MSQIQVIPPQELFKSPTTLDKVPEDVQLAIIKFIQSWKRSEGTEQEREKGKRTRDSALRAVTLSCRTLLSIYQRELLSDVTLNFKSLCRFYLLLSRDHDARKLVRSITLTRRDAIDITREDLIEAEQDLEEDLGEIAQALRAQEIEVNKETMTLVYIMEGVYKFLSNIQTLVIRRPEFNIPIQIKWASARLPPLPFLTHSLKRLFIPLWKGEESNLKARNVVWILVFCTGLRSAALGCVFDQNDFKYLAEFSGSFSGLSEVLKLSLGLNFTSTESIRRYWDKGVGKQWIGGNRKSQAVFYLLKVTKNIQCLEISSLSSSPDSETSINSNCLSALKSSFESLKYLRLLDVDPYHDGPEEYKINFSCFTELKVISMDSTVILSLARSLGLTFPPGLKIFCIPYYYGEPTISEDQELAHFLKVTYLPSLETVGVPSRPLLREGSVSKSDEFNKLWLEGRRELEKAEIFQSGKVELRLLEPGESIGESSEIDFMSTVTWLSPS